MRNLTMPFATLGRAGAIVAIAVAVFAGGLGIGAGLSATGAQSGGEIHGCVNRFTGALRIVKDAGHCTSSERPLSWNQQGAGGLMDVQVIEERSQVRTEDGLSQVTLFRVCPVGYKAVGGGGGVNDSVGNNIWAITRSVRVETDADTGWLLSMETTDGQDAAGDYFFELQVVCALSS